MVEAASALVEAGAAIRRRLQPQSRLGELRLLRWIVVESMGRLRDREGCRAAIGARKHRLSCTRYHVSAC